MLTRTVVAAALFVVGGIVSAVDAQTSSTIRACVATKSGAVRIIGASDICKQGETLMTWNQQGPQGPTGPAGPAGSTGPEGPGRAVYDANGLRVGDVDQGGHLEALIISTYDGRVFLLRVSGTGVLTTGGLYFGTPDCTGPPLMHLSSGPSLGPLLTPVHVGPPGWTVYIPDPGAVPQTLGVQSQLNGAVCSPACCVNNNAVPYLPLVDLSTVFTPPFTIR
jgi:hypothetical protein